MRDFWDDLSNIEINIFIYIIKMYVNDICAEPSFVFLIYQLFAVYEAHLGNVQNRRRKLNLGRSLWVNYTYVEFCVRRKAVFVEDITSLSTTVNQLWTVRLCQIFHDYLWPFSSQWNWRENQ